MLAGLSVLPMYLLLILWYAAAAINTGIDLMQGIIQKPRGYIEGNTVVWVNLPRRVVIFHCSPNRWRNRFLIQNRQKSVNQIIFVFLRSNSELHHPSLSKELYLNSLITYREREERTAYVINSALKMKPKNTVGWIQWEGRAPLTENLDKEYPFAPIW